ncbi:LADA_0F14048g1_1 [Lachancea dasiensis]|uniref:Autophagy-related protein 9 n=1 Tax=Lachancea dasiensis TaxID=1072105 RepID=A0A1G4JMZ9_9SACH|nr:LADA_0F14048g1_1 [Lachancea dasiensis]
MDSSGSKYNGGERNTFLSRVFGPHSTVGNSMGNTEMTQISQVSERSSLHNDDLRIIESDQGSSSDEDVDSEHYHGRIRPFDGIESVVLDPDSDLEESSNHSSSIASIPKVGQGGESDDSEFQESSVAGGEGNVDDSSQHKNGPNSPPLSNQYLQTKKLGGEPRNSNQRSPEIHGSSSNDRMFSKAFPNGRRTFLKFNENRAADQEESFLFRKGSVWDEESQGRHKGQPKAPGLFHNFANIKQTPKNRLSTLSPRERALWKWANVENLDIFLQEVYDYYLGNGFYCICIEKALNIATLLFVVFISTYLGCCIDFSKLPTSHKLSEVQIDKCYSTQITGTTKALLWGFYIFVSLKLVQLYFDIKALRDIHQFYTYLLGISDKELQTIAWQNVIRQIMLLKDQNAVTANVVEVKAKNRIDAHDVANRIMRKENYLIALFNNDVLDLSLPIPLYRTSTLTKTLEWNLNLCIIGFAFNESGYLKQSFLKTSQRSYLEEELRKRFMLAGFLNIILSPFLVAYFVLLYFFRYFNEYKTSPSAISSRQYTPIAEWKFREYNELYHLFQKRLGLSVEAANQYIDQFPKEKTNLIMKFVAFISGSFVAVLGLLAIFDPENFLNFELTSERSVLFYISIFGTIWAVCRNSVSGEYKVFDPEATLKEVVECLHFDPKDWRDRYHTEEVKNEFCKLFNLRIILLFRELASLIMTPFILWFSLPRSSGKIIDFMRDVSVYVDGLGYVCKFATFDIPNDAHDQLPKRRVSHRATRVEQDEDVSGTSNIEETSESDSEMSDKSVDKMVRSYMYFLDSYQNNDNAVGKHQLPKNYHAGKVAGQSTWLNTNYSWKRQFQPGQRPENVRLGFGDDAHPVSMEQNTSTNDQLKSRSKGQRSQRKKLRHNIDSTLGESFINSIPVGDYAAFEGADETTGKSGVLGLLNQYYKKSDVGR